MRLLAIKSLFRPLRQKKKTLFFSGNTFFVSGNIDFFNKKPTEL